MDKLNTQKYSFELNSQLSELKALNQHVSAFGRNLRLSELSISEINICLDELFTNIVSYGFKDDRVHKIKFTLKIDDNMLIACVEDDGVPFNPLQKMAPELPTEVESARIGGLGIHITRELVDKISYDRKRGKNRLTIQKSIRANETDHKKREEQ